MMGKTKDDIAIKITFMNAYIDLFWYKIIDLLKPTRIIHIAMKHGQSLNRTMNSLKRDGTRWQYLPLNTLDVM